jgi:hypothetical protein
MLLRLSRWLSLAIFVLALVETRHSPRATWLSGAIALVCIWFPALVDDVTFGTTRAGYKIDTHSPPWLIAGCGWLLLLIQASSSFFPGWLSRAFGVE